jgi:hypothetical protein
MSLERRKPFALLHPNAKPTDSIIIAPNSAPPQLPISRPRRQMPAAYHHQPHQLHNPHKRYATVLPGSSRSSATSSAESLHSTGSLMLPRRRKVSAAEDMAARVRARWAALEALERTGGAPAPIANPADAFIATNTNTATAATNTTTIRGGARSRIDPQAAAADWRPQRQWDRRGSVSLMEMSKDREKENEISPSTSMQVDEKPLPPRPAPLAFALHKFPEQAPLSAPARMPTAPSMAMAMTMGPMMVDAREGEKDGVTPGAGAGEGEILPASESTLRTTPTSLTCFETTESQRQVLQRRPTRALTPPQVRRRPSITDELEEAVRTVSIPDFMILCSLNVLYVLTEGRGYPGYAAYFAHRWTAALSSTRVRRTPRRRPCTHLPPAHPRRWSWSIRMRAVRRCIRECQGTHAARVCSASSKGCVFFTCSPLSFRVTRPADDQRSFFVFAFPLFFFFTIVERLRSVVRAWTCHSSTSQSFGKEQQAWQAQQQHPPKHYKRKDEDNYY